jgi:hypothetical protein
MCPAAGGSGGRQRGAQRGGPGQITRPHPAGVRLGAPALRRRTTREHSRRLPRPGQHFRRCTARRTAAVAWFLSLVRAPLTRPCSVALPATSQGVSAAGAQKLVGYKGSTINGSAPTCVPRRTSLVIDIALALALRRTTTSTPLTPASPPLVSFPRTAAAMASLAWCTG